MSRANWTLADWLAFPLRQSSPAPEPAPEKPSRPRIAAVVHVPTSEEFDAWRAEPVTQFVFAALRAAQDAQRDQWQAASWVRGEADELLLTELRTRADAYAGLEETDYDGFCGWLS